MTATRRRCRHCQASVRLFGTRLGRREFDAEPVPLADDVGGNGHVLARYGPPGVGVVVAVPYASLPARRLAGLTHVWLPHPCPQYVAAHPPQAVTDE